MRLGDNSSLMKLKSHSQMLLDQILIFHIQQQCSMCHGPIDQKFETNKSFYETSIVQTILH